MDLATATGESHRGRFEVHGSMFDVHASCWRRRVPTPERSLLASNQTGVAALSRGPLRPHGIRSRLSVVRSPRGIVYPMLLGAILIIGVATAGV